MLVKVLSHPGRGNAECYIIGNWTGFSLLKTPQETETSLVACDIALRMYYWSSYGAVSEELK